jgi:hypothetical protein
MTEEEEFVEIKEWGWEMVPGNIVNDGEGNWYQSPKSFWGWYDEVHGCTDANILRAMVESIIVKLGTSRTITVLEKTYTNKEGGFKIKKLATVKIHGS